MLFGTDFHDTPRRCTLTELAKKLDVSTATASNVLHRAEEQIIKEFNRSHLSGRIQRVDNDEKADCDEGTFDEQPGEEIRLQ